MDNSPIFTKREEESLVIHNLCNAMDWLPVISIISGLARTILAITILATEKNPNSEYKSYLKAEIFRGIISTICLGILFAPVDLYFSFGSSIYSDSDLEPV